MLGDALPKSGGPLSRAIGRGLLRLLGWRMEGVIPDIPKFVIVVAPHTSNWDFVVGIAAKLAMGLRAEWLGKHTLFRPPFGTLMRWLGGVPVDRTHPQDVVGQSVRHFAERKQLVLGLAPEGTRKAVQRWRTGYYHIAAGAQVPILPVSFDWSRHALVVGALVMPSNDMDADLRALDAHFEPARGRRGERTPSAR